MIFFHGILRMIVPTYHHTSDEHSTSELIPPLENKRERKKEREKGRKYKKR